MSKNEIHENHEAHKIAGELRHHDFTGARHELAKEAHNPHEFKKLVEKLNHDLKAEHQHPLSVQHDKHGNVTHLHFGKHDIYDKTHHPGHHKDSQHPIEQKRHEHKPKEVPLPPVKPENIGEPPAKVIDPPAKVSDPPAKSGSRPIKFIDPPFDV